jgi:hypothetical protein
MELIVAESGDSALLKLLDCHRSHLICGSIFVLGNRALATPGANSRDSGAQTLLDGTVGTGSQLNQRMKRNLMFAIRPDSLGTGAIERVLTAIHGDSSCPFSLKYA